MGRGQLLVDGDLILRLASEGSAYDLRDRPPVVPIDAIYDLDAGARTTDIVSGQTRSTTVPERIGLHFDLTFDGHDWRTSNVRPVAPEDLQWAIEPGPVVPGGPCTGFERDGPGAPFDDLAATSFDDRPDRTWCDADGRGRFIQHRAQVALATRYPCEAGHAAILRIGRPLGSRLDPLVRWEYVRDPRANSWRTAG